MRRLFIFVVVTLATTVAGPYATWAAARENSPVFAKTGSIDIEVSQQRVRTLLPQIQALLDKTVSLKGAEIIADTAIEVRNVMPPGTPIVTFSLSLRNRVTGERGTFRDHLIAIGDDIIFSFPGDENHTNTVFHFEGTTLIKQQALALFILETIHEPWVALSRAMRPDEAQKWMAGEVSKLAEEGGVYKGYGGRVYHFQLGLQNAYMNPGRVLVEYEADKEKLLKVLKKGALWCSVNMSNFGVHGPLFEFVLKSESVVEAKLSVQ